MKPARQARGARRIETVLAAAARLFGERGVGAVSMNEIARAAVTSPGSLYQFFPNKEAVTEALADRYARAIETIVTSALPPPTAGTTEAAVRDVIRRLAGFYAANPAYVEVYHATNRPGAESAVEARLDAAVLETLDAMIGALAPSLLKPERAAAAATILGAAHAQLSAIAFAAPIWRDKLEASLIEMLLAYLNVLADPRR